VTELMDESGFKGSVFMKDRRQPHAVLVAGITDAIHRTLDRVASRFPAVRHHRPAVFKHRYAAHLPYLDVEKLRPLLAIESFGRTRYPIVGIQGHVTGTDADPASLLQTYCHNVTGPMDTGRAVARLFQYSPRILVIGSPHGARLLAPLRPPAGRRIELAVDALTGPPGAVGDGAASPGPSLERYLG
jgi:hypothetical protein